MASASPESELISPRAPWVKLPFRTISIPTPVSQRLPVNLQGMDMSSSSDSSACQISMLFNWYTIDACFLSSGWQIKNRGMFAVTCIGVILLVILVEGLRRLGKEYDLFLTRQYQRQASMLGAKNRAHGGNIFRVTPLQQLVRAVIHALTFGGAYIIMLLAMYFNVYLIICIFIGAGLGKFLCDWMVVPVNLEDAQMVELKGVEETTICCG